MIIIVVIAVIAVIAVVAVVGNFIARVREKTKTKRVRITDKSAWCKFLWRERDRTSSQSLSVYTDP